MNWAMSVLALNALVSAGQIPAATSNDFSKERQAQCVAATVRIRNLTSSREGSGVLVGKSGPFVYVMTAQHLVQGGEKLEVDTFAKDTYPNPKATYRSAKVTAESRGATDLALVRIRTTDAMPGFLRICPVAKIPDPLVLPLLTIGCENGKAPSALVEKQVEKKMAQRPGSKEPAPYWVIDSKYHGGRSGGPLIDKQGFVLGICSGTNRDKSYFIHIDTIHRFLAKNGYRWFAAEPDGK